MFQTDLEMDQEGMTVPYPPLFDNIRKNHGFVDIRGRPDFASEIAEGAGSSAMQALLIALAQPGSKLFTIGCDIGAKRVDGDIPYTAGGYIQIMNSEYARREPDDYARFAQAVADALKSGSRRPRVGTPVRSEAGAIPARQFRKNDGITLDLVSRIR
jgi:hypothetical protein